MDMIMAFLQEWIWIGLELLAFVLIMSAFVYLIWEVTIGWGDE